MAQEKSLNRSVLHLLYRAMQCASNMFESEIQIMTPRQFAVLAALDGLEGASQAELTSTQALTGPRCQRSCSVFWPRALLSVVGARQTVVPTRSSSHAPADRNSLR